MALVNMENTSKEKSEREGMLAEPCAPDYPYGLSLDLNEESLAKLGFSPAGAGAIVSIQAIGKVTSVSESESEEGGKRRNVCIQITDLDIVPANPPLYPKMEKKR